MAKLTAIAIMLIIRISRNLRKPTLIDRLFTLFFISKSWPPAVVLGGPPDGPQLNGELVIKLTTGFRNQTK